MIIIGLCNSDRKFRHSVHNLGDEYAKSIKFIIEKIFNNTFSKINHTITSNYKLDQFQHKKSKVHINVLKIYGFINQTGENIMQQDALKQLLNENNKILIAYDDINMKTNRIQITNRKSNSRHNGVISIYTNIINKEIWRLKIGFQKPQDITANDFVTSTIFINNIIFNTINKVAFETIDLIDKYLQDNNLINMQQIQNKINANFL